MEIYQAEDDTLFGWKAANPNITTLEDYRRNGKFCKSGLAFMSDANEATCTDVKTVFF